MNTVAGFDIDIPIYNASGPRCTSLKELNSLDTSESAIVLTKSTTLNPRDGNQGVRYWESDEISINSTGLANLGYKKYIEFSKYINKPYIISVAGLSLENNLTMLKEIQGTVELNLSCPNIKGKPQIAYDFEMTDEYLRKIFEMDYLKLGVKLPPYFDNSHWDTVSDILKEYPIKFVTCINSIGNVLYIEDENLVITPNKGHGGMGGTFILPISLANVRKFRQLLPSYIDIIGCGGVKTGKDVFKHILCGADAVQVGTAFVREGPDIFTRLKKELLEIMKNKNYKSIIDFKNKLN